MGVDDVHLRVGDRPPDRDRLACGQDRRHRRPDRRLGGAVHVEQLPTHARPDAVDESGRHGLAAQQQTIERRHRAEPLGVGRQDGSQRRRALQVGDAMPGDLRGHAVTLVAVIKVIAVVAVVAVNSGACGGQRRRGVALLAQRVQVDQGVEHRGRVDAEVDEAGDLVHAERAQPIDGDHA